jgi:hypothetical protein
MWRWYFWFNPIYVAGVAVAANILGAGNICNI